MTKGGGEPLTVADIAGRLERLGNFEPAPCLAVGVSGGADSMALALLAHDWAVQRGGTVVALTVDHGLRPEAAAEAAQVGTWLQARGIAHEILRWQGGKPASGLQDQARAARRRLLAQRCRAGGILHLLLAHHRDDQAETVLLRLSHGSGPDGLAGMAPVRWDADVRVLRPLLDIPHARLTATCAARGQAWVEDPSNRSPAYARARLRAAGAVLSAEGLTAERLCDTARRAGRARAVLDGLTTDLLAVCAEVRPEGWVRLDPAALLAAREEIGLRALARVLVTVGGAAYSPRLERLERLFAEIRTGGLERGRTLGGCRILPRGAILVVAREPAAVTERLALSPGQRRLWDGRFTVALAPGEATGPVTVEALGSNGWRVVRGVVESTGLPPLPDPVRVCLPALWRGGVPVAVPFLGVSDPAWKPAGVAQTIFTPAVPLGGPAFPVV